ncbi:hypothetical protein [Halovenus sp. HT40]|uniref:hypothetical protein n=1 Tax=Halovenus sp. HT40 TaxID=3126691 RepID=UPI00300EC3A9
MPAKTDPLRGRFDGRALLDRVFSGRFLVMLLAGIVAGYSLSILGDTVVVPVIGSVPGAAVSGLGIAVSLATINRTSCCDQCGEWSCDCPGDCEESCSVEP